MILRDAKYKATSNFPQKKTQTSIFRERETETTKITWNIQECFHSTKGKEFREAKQERVLRDMLNTQQRGNWSHIAMTAVGNNRDKARKKTQPHQEQSENATDNKCALFYPC